VRGGIACVATVFFLAAGISLRAEEARSREKFWYAGAGVGYAAPFFFGLINDIHATVPGAVVFNVFAGREWRLTPSQRWAAELDLMRTLPVTAYEENFQPTFSQGYPAGSTIWYRNVTQTVVVVYARYIFELSERWNLFARLGAGARLLNAQIELVSASGTYTAASPSGAMAILSAGFGVEFNAGAWGRISLSYQSIPPVVYRVDVGTTTVRSSDMLLMQWRYAF
jgi:hypothetical protein